MSVGGNCPGGGALGFMDEVDGMDKMDGVDAPEEKAVRGRRGPER